jgi:predicted transposase YbfD/YdcC
LSCHDAISGVPAAARSACDDAADLHGYRDLAECLAVVPDPRRRHGTRHKLAVILAFAVAAVLAGADSVTAVAEWAADAPAEVLAALGAWRDRRGRLVPPCLKTFRRVLSRLDAEAAAAGFAAWLTGQVLAGLDPAAVQIALDGKTARGARSGDKTAPHLLAAMICGCRVVIAQRDINVKTNEITQVRPLLADADIAGALVTADAMHVQKDTARFLVEDKHADYLFTAVKENQPGLFAALDALDWENTPVTHVMQDRGHGRAETRTLQVLPAPDGLFPHAAQAFLIERTVRDPGSGQLRSAAAALGLTSRTAQSGATPEVIARAARRHWDIEAMHHIRDVSLDEDAQRLRASSSAQVMASARNTAIAILRLAGITSAAAGRRWASRNPARPITAMGLAI